MDDLEKELERLRKQYESEPDDPRLDNVGALSRYFIWADKMRHDFQNLVMNRGNLDEFTFLEHSHIYMSYWYGALYVLIEGWRDLGLKDEKIDGLIGSPYVDLLRRYRNAVFHFQKKFSDKRFMDLMLAGKESVEWVSALHREFGRFFMTWWKANKKSSSAK
ncbi:MAG TPA: hypothetical protein VF791_04915 [Pyrinomonadaceae bacterium]